MCVRFYGFEEKYWRFRCLCEEEQVKEDRDICIVSGSKLLAGVKNI